MTGAAAQPRRLAVLALLARAGRPGITREKILALLWPDEPEERARRSLNQAVYSLRRDLGDEDALLGAKDLRLNLDRIEVDTIEFDDAIKENDVERAIRLYDGPFLDGLFVARAGEFERWVEAERAALALDYARALERAATGAGERGDHQAAVALWRKLAATDPLNGRVTLSVMTALVAALGLLPAAIATGVGTDSQRPFALVIVTGMISRLLIGVFVAPALYLLVARSGDRLQV